MNLRDYLLSFDTLEGDPPQEYTYDEIMQQFFGGIAPRTSICPICGGQHYFPISITTSTTISEEMYRDILQQICEMNRDTYYFSVRTFDPQTIRG